MQKSLTPVSAVSGSSSASLAQHSRMHLLLGMLYLEASCTSEEPASCSASPDQVLPGTGRQCMGASSHRLRLTPL